jgi:hypothetical protein
MARRLRSRHYGGTLALLVAAATASTALDASLSPLAGNLTAACWVKGTAQTTTTEVLELVNATSADGLAISISAGSLIAKVRGGTAASVAAAIVLNGSWHRVTASCDASTKTIVLYVDGVQVATSGAAAWAGSFPATCKLGLGLGSIGNSALTTQGDAVLDIGHAWSALDVAADYYDATPPASYTHRWPLDDGSGPTARATRGGLALTLGGAAAFSADSPMIGRGVVRNFAPSSDDLSAASWAKSGLGTPVPYVGAFATGVGASLITDTAANAAHQAAIVATGAPAPVFAGAHVVSGYAKKVAGNDWITIREFYGAGDAGYQVSFNLATGSLGSILLVGSTKITPYIEPTANGSYRCSVYVTRGSNAITGGDAVIVYMSNADLGLTYAGGANQVAIGGFQIEPCAPGQTTPSPYVATGAAPLSVYGAREWRQNFTRYSEDQTVAAHWSVSNSAPTLDGTLTPDGKVATRIADTATNTAHYIAQASTVDGGSATDVRTFIFVAKMDTRRYMAMFADNGNKGILVDLQSGSIPNAYGTTGTAVRALGGGWYEFKFRATCSVTGSPTFVIYGSSGPTAAETIYVGNGSAFYVSKCQQLRGDFLATPVDYIKTTSAPANSSGAPRSKAGVRTVVAGTRVKVT